MMKDCPLCHNEGLNRNPDKGLVIGADWPLMYVRCGRCGLQVTVVAKDRTLHEKRKAIEEAEHRWNHITRSEKPYKVQG